MFIISELNLEIFFTNSLKKEQYLFNLQNQFTFMLEVLWLKIKKIKNNQL